MKAREIRRSSEHGNIYIILLLMIVLLSLLIVLVHPQNILIGTVASILGWITSIVFFLIGCVIFLVVINYGMYLLNRIDKIELKLSEYASTLSKISSKLLSSVAVEIIVVLVGIFIFLTEEFMESFGQTSKILACIAYTLYNYFVVVLIQKGGKISLAGGVLFVIPPASIIAYYLTTINAGEYLNTVLALPIVDTILILLVYLGLSLLAIYAYLKRPSPKIV